MFKYKAVLRHEWSQFLRQPWTWVAFIIFFLISWLSIDFGNRAVKSRVVQIDTISANYKADLQAHLRSFTDTLTERGRSNAKTAGKAFMVNYRLPQTCIKTPSKTSALSLGLSEIRPWHAEVTYTKDFNETDDAPVSNPLVLFVGSIDFSFVLIYLLPLLVFINCYSLYASEKEAGTLPLLSIHFGNIDFLIRVKLISRFIILSLYTIMLVGFAFMMAEQRQPSPAYPGYWIALSIVYLFFWFSIVYLILSFRQSANISLLLLSSCWVLLVMVIPASLSMYIQAKEPMPLQDEIASYRRHQGKEIWNMSAKVLSDTFNHAHPEYAATADPAKDTLNLSDRYVAGYYYLLERRMNKILLPYEQKMNTQNEELYTSLHWSPPFLMDNLLNKMADNDLGAHQQFNQQVDLFQKRWQRFLYPYHFSDKSLTPDIIRQLPKFNYIPANSPEVSRTLFYLFFISIGLLLVGRLISFNMDRFL